MCTSVFVVCLLLVGAVTGNDDEKQATLRFYHNSMKNYTESSLEESHKMFSTEWYDRNKQFFVFVHGFTGEPEGPAVTAVITSMIERGDANVALLNWKYLASQALPGLLNSYMNWAVPNAIHCGTDFAKTLVKSADDGGLDLNKTHFVGHSLGAHVLGVAGNEMLKKGIQLPWITGLDPATGLDMKPPQLRLNPRSARFTSAVHSDPSKYGSKRELGLVNFWPNYRAVGPVRQPGCTAASSETFSQDELCSHHRSWQLYIDAMQNPGTILGSYAKNFKLWKRYKKEQREANTLDLATLDLNALPGNYFFVTNENKPYGLGLEGLKPEWTLKNEMEEMEETEEMKETAERYKNI